LKVTAQILSKTIIFAHFWAVIQSRAIFPLFASRLDKKVEKFHANNNTTGLDAQELLQKVRQIYVIYTDETSVCVREEGKDK